MVLIPKGERETTNPSNYRPISLLENILERIINERQQRHLEDNELLNEDNLGSGKEEFYRTNASKRCIKSLRQNLARRTKI